MMPSIFLYINIFRELESAKSLQFFRGLCPFLVIGFWLGSVQPALAHASQQGFILLLPTDVYTITGCLAVVASILIVSLMPHGWMKRLMQPIGAFESENQSHYDLKVDKISARARVATSLLSLGILLGLIVVGSIGTRDPLANILPLFIWTVWWIAIVLLHGIIGNLWVWINPWTGLYSLVFGATTEDGLFKLPKWLDVWPATISYLGFSAFVIADPAPNDPSRLSLIVLAYLVFTFLGMIVFGSRDWLSRCEGLSVMLEFIATLSPVKLSFIPFELKFGLPGWKTMSLDDMTFGRAIFALVVLGSGSFDGVNETFWWLAHIGVNPLEFPGRSAVLMESVVGLVIANILLVAVFSGSVCLGLRLGTGTKGHEVKYGSQSMFGKLALSVLPIALAYHATHYSVSFMIEGQYVIAAVSDPFATGANYLAIENYQVTTGFLNTQESVRQIWLSQAGVIVVGHILAVLMAHAIITGVFEDKRQALLCHLPIAAFMTFYTWFGLWLLAAPKGG